MNQGIAANSGIPTMAALSSSLSSSHAVIDLGFNEYGQGNCKQKREYGRQESAVVSRQSRGQCRAAFGVLRRPRNLAASRLLVQNSRTPNEDSVVLRVRSRDDSYKGASSISTKPKNPFSELGPSPHEYEGRPKLLKKLSEANQYIRHLQHELREKEEALVETASEMSAMEMELQVLVNLAQEISRQGIKPGTRKINGRYIHSHLASRLEEMQKILKEQIKDADLVRTRSIGLVYYGMAEDVQVMGSFDGWTRGEQMSPESTGTFTKFTTNIKLRPGRYEIKFLVDGEWHLSPDLPTVGEGLTQNNLLVVDRL
ncbi:hypothetical protein KC19_2G089800 [Ceratodon purpureus]|uniref:AMP-activated protein kinase glycogen-binding domain-containing protein n=1 Tax=Ceratodon purpureus TaxID=3225 RepID=A0A8T0IRS3_CERPU|nr:hypothetical protein KC19_2G089800 [Ceratodon purpureus]